MSQARETTSARGACSDKCARCKKIEDKWDRIGKNHYWLSEEQIEEALADIDEIIMVEDCLCKT